MRIGINALYLRPGKVGGTETYLLNLLHELSALDTRNDYFLFMNQKCLDTFEHLPPAWKKIVCELSPRWKPFRVFWEQWKLPRLAQDYSIELLHSPSYVSPIPGDYAKIVTLFDMHYHYYPETFSLAKRIYWNRYIPQSAKQVDMILTLSDCSKKDIHKILKIPENKIRVTPAAVAEDYLMTRTQNEISEFLKSKAIQQPYILSIATFNRHKNLNGLIRCFSKLKESYSCPHKLVLAGVRGNYYSQILNEIQKSNYKKDIQILDYLPIKDLPLLYQGADLFVLLSYFEGFGLPILEAMAGGTPVLCSNRTSLPEVAGDAAILVDPDDESSIVNSLIDLLEKPELRKSLSDKGKEQVKKFSWKKMAELTLSAYQDAFKLWKENNK